MAAALFDDDRARGRRADWQLTSPRTATAEIDLGRPTTVGIVRLGEDISRGQVVARHSIAVEEGTGWRTVASGTTIGYMRLTRLEAVTARRIRITIDEAMGTPDPITVGIFPADAG